MPEHIKALCVILALAATVFAAARVPATYSAMAPRDFADRRIVWFALTIVAFLAGNFWIYIVVAGAILAYAGARDKNPIALHFAMLLAVPAAAAQISGLGIINFFFEIDHIRLLSLTVLLPAYLKLHKDKASARFGRLAPDRFVAGFVVLNLLLQLTIDTVTNTMRFTFYAFIDVYLPYYVASRGLRDIARFREAMMGLVLAAMALAAMAVFEAGRHWLLYSSLDEAWGLSWGYGGYLERGEGGVLRAQGTTGQPIALGYVMAVALGFFLFLQKSVPGTLWKAAGFGLILAGLVASVSRGPWVGALALLLVFMVTGPRAGVRLMQAAGAALVIAPLLFLTSLGERIVDYLPFVGTVEEENITYRQRLIEIAIDVVLQNPLFGAFDYIYSPAFQELKQGQGIIDVVNTYLGIGLSSGLVGLGLFAGFFVAGIAGVCRVMNAQADKSGEVHLLGRALLASMVCIVVTIFTVSSITVVAPIYWCVVGLAAGYAVFAPAPQGARSAALGPGTPLVRPA